ncbi:MAG: RHS repeat-associated core domain-containing protein [Arenicella sp.]
MKLTDLTNKNQLKTDENIMTESILFSVHKGTTFLLKALVNTSVSAVLLATGLTSAWASKTIYETNNYTKATHEEMVEDMRVKVLGGSIAVNRYYRVVKQRTIDADGNVLYVGVSGATGAFSGNSLRGRAGSVSRSTGGGSASGSASAIDVGQANASYGVWQFHRKWHDLVFLDRDLSTFNIVASAHINGDGGSGGGASLNGSTYEPKDPVESGGAKYIDRNDFVYIKKPGSDYYEYQHNGADLRITEIDGGYRWSNRRGDWVEYNDKGKATRSGDRNDVSITLVRNSEGYISQYKDHLGRVVLTYSYVGNKPVRVEDYTGRRVSYDWDGNYLKKVTTTRGHDWSYDYEAVGNNVVLTKKTDPENQTFTYNYEMSGGGYIAVSNSNGNISTLGDATSVASFVNNGGGGGSYASGRSIAVPSMLMHTAKVYPDGKRQRYQYFYDQDSKTYTLIETDSDGYERERWFDLDGQTQQQFKGGLLANKRIRNGRTAVATDAYGNKTTTQYTRWEAIASITHPDGSSKSYQYMANYNFPTLEVDEIGVKTKHEYDDKGNRIKTIKDFGSNDERVIEFAYDEYGQLKVERYLGRDATPTIEIKYDYDDYGNVVKHTDAKGHITQYNNFNVIGQHQEMIDGRGNSWKYEYDAQGNIVKEITPQGFITQYTYDNLHRLASKVDAELRQTTYAYDSRDNQITQTNNLGDSRINTYRFDKKVLTERDESNQLRAYRYDRSGRLIETTDGVGNLTVLTYERGDELAGSRVQKVTTPNNLVFYKYDERNRRIQQRVASTITKDDGLENRTVTEYSKRSERLKVIDGNDNVTTYVYNRHQQLIEETNSEQETVKYGYDVRGNLLTVTDAEQRMTQYEYDNNNNKVAEIRPMGERQTYAYNANDGLVVKTDFNGNVANYSYDSDNRIATLSNTKAGDSSPERTVTYSFDKSNRDLGYNDGVTSTVYQLDGLGRQKQQTTTFINAGFSKVLKTDYYPNSQIKTRTDAENTPTLYTYDGAGKLKSIQIATAGTILIDDYEGNLPSTISYPGGTKRTQEYDGLARLKQILVKNNADNTLMDYQYGFDNVGNITYRNTQQGNFTYGYDNAYRITSANQPNSFGNQTYSYDKNGNRKTQDKAGADISYAHNENHELNQIIEGTITSLLVYDDNGAIMQQQSDSQTQSYTYNSYARIAEIQQGASSLTTLASYRYDAMSRRVVKNVDGNSTYFLYTESGLCGEYDSNGNLIRGYVYQPEGYFLTYPLAMKMSNVNSNSTDYVYSYYQNDYIGTPQLLIQISGEVVWQGDYDVFGQITETNTIVKNPLRFPGQYQDSETGLYYNWNRYYTPELGRYITNDPIGLDGGLGVFVYSKNNPNLEFDPKGLKPPVNPERLPPRYRPDSVKDRKPPMTDFRPGGPEDVRGQLYPHPDIPRNELTDAGNYNFGYAGAVHCWPLEVLLLIGDWVQFAGGKQENCKPNEFFLIYLYLTKRPPCWPKDNPRDASMIREGYNDFMRENPCACQ